MAVEQNISGRTEGRASRVTESVSTDLPPIRRQGGRRIRCLICELRETSLDGLFLDAGKKNTSLRPIQVDFNASHDIDIPSHLDACVIVLPKRIYLSRVFELPAAQPDELAEMIRLEAEATIPSDYGPAEAAYRELPVDDGDPLRRRYEVYLVRTEIVDRCVSTLETLGLSPCHILPSAVFWSQALNRGEDDHDRDDLLISPVGKGEYETAHHGRRGDVVVRSLSTVTDADLHRGLIESVRAMTGDRASTDESVIRIGYLSERPPNIHQNGRVRTVDRTVSGFGDDASLPEASRMAFLQLALKEWIESPQNRVWESANLLPQTVTQQAVRRRMYRQLAIGSGGFIVAMLLVLTGLHISTWRYQTEIVRLDVAIERIRTDGEAVGDQLAQLEAVAEARATRNDFAAVIGGLHDAVSPDGDLSYSQVDLRDDGTLLLRGQADSLALPFELPQRLEVLPAFAGVQLLDAGQTKKGIGSVTEFRIEANHQRGGTP